MANTPNLGLHQWSAGDSFLRTDFNSDFSKIDTAVEEQLKSISGNFIGDGIYPRRLILPKKPKLLLLKGVYRAADTREYPAYLLGTEIIQFLFVSSQEYKSAVTFLNDGFQLTLKQYFNESGCTTNYFCLY